MYNIIYDNGGNTIAIRRLSDNALIPFDNKNSDFRSFLIWNSQQAEPLDYETPIVVPAAYSLRPEQQLIVANGLHVAKVMASVNCSTTSPATDTMIINSEEQTIDLVNGTATIEFTSTIPGTIIYLEYHGLYAVVEAK